MGRGKDYVIHIPTDLATDILLVRSPRPQTALTTNPDVSSSDTEHSQHWETRIRVFVLSILSMVPPQRSPDCS